MIEFFVPGIPKPGGSKRFVGVSKAGRGILVDASGKAGKDWRTTCQVFAREAYQGEPLTGALFLWVSFHMPRPKSHYGTGRNASILKPSAPDHHISRPDTTKLVRALEDALTGILWRDDAQIAAQSITKYYSNRAGAHVIVKRCEK